MQISDPEPAQTIKPAGAQPQQHWLDRWHVNPTLAKDFDAIDGLRGLAILMVLACHLIWFNPESNRWVRFVGGAIAAGGYGVTIFFALSGFLISHPFWKRKIRPNAATVPTGYGWRRFWKIYPPLALSVLLLTPIYFARSGDASYFATAAQWLIGWPVVHPVRSQINPVMWSLVVEIHFYILLPLLFIAIKPIPARASVWLLFLGFLLVPTAMRWWNIANGAPVFELHPQINVHFPLALDAFAFGVFLAGLENLQQFRKSWARLGDLGLIVIVIGLCSYSVFQLRPIASPEVQNEIAEWLVKIGAALALCYVADPQHPRSRLLSQPWLRWVGIISYEWYLFHQPIAIWTREAIGQTHGNLLKYALAVAGPFVASLLTAAAVYKFFSLPILKFGRSRNVPV